MTGIAPFSKTSDVDVVLTILKPRPVIGLGNMLILNELAPVQTTPTSSADSNADSSATQPATNTPSGATKVAGLLMDKTDSVSGAVYREYANADAVLDDYDEDYDNPVYAKAASYFAQTNPSDRVAVLSYPQGKLQDALKAFWFNNWTFAVTTSTNEDDLQLASNIFETNKDHFLLIQRNDINAFEKFVGQNYTIGIKHDESEAMDAALIGSTASLTVGSVNWKFRELEGITPDELTSGELSQIRTAHLIAYITINGQGETTDGTVMSGDYIDSLHGDIWVKTNIESELQSLLQSYDKIPYDSTGINLISAKVTSVLQKAYEQGIILEDETTNKGSYTVTATPRSAQPQADLSKRHYGGVSFTYHRSGAIDTVKVAGTIESDTLTNN
ncbi:DUF3383 family protein [Lactobacillus sp.]|uniref:DUF3383 family protein n=1 Tax=Lactobacillus sp. TaxID=1591 RepID=UPI00199BBA53|nr:DUF3383 family protein [Lactobacillus sp.]MBD5430142.1 DUF3383 domain-containing protein [Lactobacillus sp.]